MNLEKRNCLSCGELLKGRKDQKFCSSYCRNNHHNSNVEDLGDHVRKVNGILRKNLKILMELNTTGKATLSSAVLIEKGFNFNYYTNTYTTKKGVIYSFCYDYGYSKIADDMYILVKKQEYVA